ncbi:unnamed protein product [Meloidogyne enterolobii]|uniref:Uncharacterized protein n=2 Tax=Meloidogyne enterolobii TaxID=390850 RepID=A0ACB0Z142_MELEN
MAPTKSELQQIMDKLAALELKIDNNNTKFSSFSNEILQIKNALTTIESKIQTIETTIETNLKNNENSASELERRRSIVLIGLPESKSTTPSIRVAEDKAAAEGVLNWLGVEAPFVSYRMGKFDPTNRGLRLVKIIFAASQFQRISLAEWKRRRNDMRKQENWSRLLIRPSLTKEQLEADRMERARKRDEFKKLNPNSNVTERSKNK